MSRILVTGIGGTGVVTIGALVPAVFAARQRRQFVRAGLHLFEQAAVTVGQADQPRLDALAAPGAQSAFDQPGAVGIDPLNLRHIDRNGARQRLDIDGSLHERLERDPLPDVEGGIPAARKKRPQSCGSRILQRAAVCGRLVPPGWEARLYVRQGCLTPDPTHSETALESKRDDPEWFITWS